MIFSAAKVKALQMARSGTEMGSKEMLGVTRIIHFVLLLVGVSCIAETSALECPYSDPVCDCTGNTAICSTLTELLPVRTGNDVYNISVVILLGDGINSLSKENLPADLNKLELNLSPLTNISDDAFDNSATTLGILYIDTASFKQLPQAMLKLTNLTTLSLSNIPLDQWQDSILQHIAPKITDLALNNVNLRNWPSWLSYFHSLVNLDLSGNYLNNIPDNAFYAVADKLHSLTLSSTNLTQVPHAISALSSLASLFLSENSFSETEVEKLNSFPLTETLTSLGIDNVGLTRFPNLSHLTYLTALSLDKNNISDPNSGSFPQSLDWLDISGNTLSSVPAWLANLSNLQSLMIFYNQITQIQPDSFPLSLTHLALASNKLTTITNTSFTKLSHLVNLYLDLNPISVIETGAFSGLVSLKTLFLTFTDLTEVPLALISLPSDIDIDMFSLNTFSCHCPAPPELVTWYQSLKYKTIIVNCNNGQSVSSYLSGQCRS